MNALDRNFACTQCGQCCNRPPEVELGEVAALAGDFVWQVLFRLYSLPPNLDLYHKGDGPREQAGAEFFDSKRLLDKFAAYSWAGEAEVDGKVEPRNFYLSISALALDGNSGKCDALGEAGRCTIYDRRPLSCRSVPLHYSRGEAFAVAEYDVFTSFPGHACDTGPTAPSLLQGGKIANPDILAARAQARELARKDSRWKHAIVRAMKAGRPGLPTLAQVQEHAHRGALSTPMQFAWHVAVESGLLTVDAYQRLLAAQSQAVTRFLQRSENSADSRVLAEDVRKFILAAKG